MINILWFIVIYYMIYSLFLKIFSFQFKSKSLIDISNDFEWKDLLKDNLLKEIKHFIFFIQNIYSNEKYDLQYCNSEKFQSTKSFNIL